MKNHIIIFCLLFSISAQAQNWNQLKYNEYQYGLEDNPYKGFATMWDVQTNFPNSIQGVIFKFNDIVTGDSLYDWTIVDNFMNNSALAGKHVSLQVNIDPVKNAHLDLPQYLMDSLSLDSTTIGQSDLVYYDELQDNGDINSLVSPNWNNPTLMKAMLDFIGAFGDRYDGDDRIFNVAMGLYGMWGEWHVFPFQDTFPHLVMTQTNMDLLSNKYLASFPNSNVVARYPQSVPAPNSFGYSDGLFFEQSIGSPVYYFDNLLTAHAPNSWQTNPIGGEVSPELQDTIFHQWPNLEGSGLIMSDGRPHEVQNTIQSITQTHSTWLFANYLFADPKTTKISEAEKNNALRVHKKLGYNFFLKQYELTAVDSIPTLKVGIKNNGIAPIYANWDVEFAVLDSADSLLSLNTANWNLDDILPSHYIVIKSIPSLTALNDGSYTVLLRIKNPLEVYSDKAPPVRFANETQDLHRVGWLSVGEMTMVNGTISGISDATATGPLGGVNSTIPGMVEGEHFNNGGNGIAYNDDATRNGITQFRPSELVDIVRKNTASKGFAVGYTKSGEWLDYTVDVATTNRYDITLQYYCNGNAGDLKLSLDGVELTTISGIQSQSNWSTRASVTIENILIQSGENQILRLEYINGSWFDIDVLEFKRSPLIQDGIYTLKSKTGAFIRPASSGGYLKSELSAMGDSTKWKFTNLGDDVYRIESVQYPLERIELPYAHCGQGELAGITTYTGPEDHLKWKATEEGNYIMFEPMHCLGFALDAWASNADTVHLWWRNPGNDNQLFELIEEPVSSSMLIVGSTLGIKSESSNISQITVYPNPVSETLNINISDNNGGILEIKIFDIQGKLLYTETSVKQVTSINTESLNTNGILIVQISNQNETKSFKVVKL